MATEVTTSDATASAERLKAFIDAVVAIAMTLLILPLMESVVEAGRDQLLTSEWLAEHGGQLISFLLSFALIADAWRDHHRLFDAVHSITSSVVWLSVLWMLTIVWLPVPTAMLGSLKTDATQKVLYIGTLLAMRVAMLAVRLLLQCRPELHDIAPERLRSSIVANVILVVFLAAILCVALALPRSTGYLALFALVLVGPLHAVVWRRMKRPV